MKPVKPVILLIGPTAVGKTELSIALAKAIGAEIVSVDSRLLYRGMSIGTAKPAPAVMDTIRHHLIDVAEPTETWSLSRYLKAVELAISGIHDRRNVPLLVGGTGQYLAAIVEGWQPPPRADDPGFRQEMQAIARREGPKALHARLAQVDPAAADRIDARNVRRVVRALEIYHVTNTPPSEQRKRVPPEYSFLILGLKRDREELYQRIDDRIEAMIAAGWVEEVASLLDQGLSEDSPALSAIGYRQIAEYLEGQRDMESVLLQTQRLTRQFVRRQDNWFRRLGSRVNWFDAERDPAEEMIELARTWLDGEQINGD
jgi:tRNA dimethylallyltransferase